MSQPFFDAKSYWENRLSRHSDLKGVGHVAYGNVYNYWLYRRKKACVQSFFHGRSLQGKDVLDIGSGTGFFIEWYLRQGASVYGIDISEASIQRLSQKLSGDFAVVDISDENYCPPRQFDVINAWDVIYHVVDDTAFYRSLENMAKSCQAGGVLLLTDWLGASSDHRIAPHAKVRCLATYLAPLSNLGFKFTGLEPFCYFLMKRRIPYLDNLLAPVYFWLDNHVKRIPGDNFCLGVWQRREVGP